MRAQQDAVTQYWAETQCTGQRSSSLIKVCHVSAMLPKDPVLTGFNTLLEASYIRCEFSDVLQGCVYSQKLKTVLCDSYKWMMTFMGLTKKFVLMSL